MPNLLISGPAGAGKTELARRELHNGPLAVAADFQSILAALRLLQRLPNGRYPRRSPQDEALLPLTEYIRQTIIRAAPERGVRVVATNSDGSMDRRRPLLGRLGADATERIIDPGEEVVRARLSDVDGVLDPQCEGAIGRWYGR